MRTIILILASFFLTSMFAISKNDMQPEQLSKMKQFKEIYLAGGCFWGTEHFVQQIHGVIETEVGYANGKKDRINPTYEDVSNKQMGFAETVKVV